MIGALLKKIVGAASKTGAGRAISGLGSLATSSGRSEAFGATPVGRLMPTKSASDAGSPTSADDAAPVSRSGASGLHISKQTLAVLESIDENLRRMVDALGLQQQKEEAAKEEAASEAQTPGDGGGGGGGAAEGPGFFRKFSRLIIGLALSIAQIAMPLYETVKAAVQWMIDMGMKVFDFLSEKFLKLFTEDIPHFFVETVPDFFMNTLPEVFFSGVDFLKEKMDSILKSIGDILGTIKKNIGGMIVDLADSSAAKFLLPEGLRTSIKEFGQNMQKTEAAGDKAAKTPDKSSAAQKQEAAKKEQVATAVEIPPAAPGVAGMGPNGGPGVAASASAAAAAGGVGGAAGMGASGAGGVGGAAAGAGGNVGGIGTPAATQASSAGGVGGGIADGVGDSGGMSGASLNAGSMAGGTGGGTAEALGPNGGTGGAVAAASMAASAPEVEKPMEAYGPTAAKNMNKPKANPDPVNPIANVPDVFPSLGSIADLWYHNASSLVAA